MNIGLQFTTWKSDGEQQRFPSNQIAAIRTANRSRGAGQGLLIGLLSGVGMGALVGLASGASEGFVDFSAGGKALLAGAALGVVFGFFGTILGVSAGAPDIYLLTPPTPDAADSLQGSQSRARSSAPIQR
jgi:hypothetical protein